MRLFSSLRRTERSMLHKLIGSMLALAAVLLFTLWSGLFLFGKFSSPEKEMSDTLELQMKVFENDVTSVCEETAASGILLSRSAAMLLEQHLAQNNLTFSQLNDNPDQLAAVQAELIDPLRQILLQSDCSGAFIMLNATVNSGIPESQFSRSGLYIQRNESMADQKTLLLYRGNAELGKANNIMPHRKWRLEFRTDLFPNSVMLPADNDAPSDVSYNLSEMFQLPGTSERAVIMSLPLVGKDGSVYGVCGFEFSQSYFQIHMAQPTGLPHLTCLLTLPREDGIHTDASLSCGAAGGCYLAPTGILTEKSIGSGMHALSGSTIPYAAKLRSVYLTPEREPFLLAVMTPKAALDRTVMQNNLQALLMFLLLLFFTVSCCIFFSRRFLSPILRSLEQIRSDNPPVTHSGFQEIDDLFGFLAEKDREHGDALLALEQEKQDAQSAYRSVRDKYETAQSEIARLAYTRTQEIDPDEYQIFLDGIQNLTPTEHMIFGYYLAGHTVKEILEIAEIKESTLRYHNRNIYSKLGVNSLKQLLRYAALMQWKNENPSTPPS